MRDPRNNYLQAFRTGTLPFYPVSGQCQNSASVYILEYSSVPFSTISFTQTSTFFLNPPQSPIVLLLEVLHLWKYLFIENGQLPAQFLSDAPH
jgi:hypothetical protein